MKILLTSTILTIVMSAIAGAKVLSPILGNYPDTSLALSTDTTVTPYAAPMNTTRINVSTSTNFKGRLEGYPATGVVRVTDAHPAGTYTVTVRAFDGDGGSVTRTFMLTVTTPPTCNPMSFAPTHNFAAGNQPRSVAIGDFNGDGRQDLAVLNGNSHDISIFLGDGAGNFGPPMNFPVGDPYPDAIAVGDFNADGNQDLVVTNYDYYANSISILLGDGTGSFSAPAIFDGGPFPTSVVVGDFNEDGYQDIAVNNTSPSGVVSILLGDGTGNFGARIVSNVGDYPRSVALGDFNADGHEDLAVTMENQNTNSNGVSVLLGDGFGHFGTPRNFATGPGGGLMSVAVGDFNGDGNQDLAVANGDSHTISILLGDGTGNFSTATTVYSLPPLSLQVGDFNGDGNQDLVVAGQYQVSVLLNDGAAHFSSQIEYPADYFAVSVAVGDFNGDGRQDLAVANLNSNDVSILLRDCTLALTRVVSRHTHGDAGSFDIDLPLMGSPGIECRTTGGTNDHTIVVILPTDVTTYGQPGAVVAAGTATIGSGGVGNDGHVTISGNTVSIPLTNVANGQLVDVVLWGVNSIGNLLIPMAVLAGDVNGNGTVNASDVAFGRAHIGQPLDATNFRADMNANGVINAADVSLIKSKIGTGLP